MTITRKLVEQLDDTNSWLWTIIVWAVIIGANVYLAARFL